MEKKNQSRRLVEKPKKKQTFRRKKKWEQTPLISGKMEEKGKGGFENEGNGKRTAHYRRRTEGKDISKTMATDIDAANKRGGLGGPFTPNFRSSGKSSGVDRSQS